MFGILAFWPAQTLAAAEDPPARRPHYDLDITLDQTGHRVHVRQRIAWVNPTRKPLDHLVVNFYPHYRVPPGDYLLLAKTLELLRMQPSQAIDRGGRHGVIGEALLLQRAGKSFGPPTPLPFEFDADTPTILRFPLSEPLQPGESITIEIGFCLHLPNKQGRWGYWNGVTFVTNSLPLLAFCDDSGWQPTPFVPWAQPWFNEAGIFTAKFDMPADEVLACPALIDSEQLLPGGRKEIRIRPFLGRDFSFLCSKKYQEFKSQVKLPDGRTLPIRCMALPGHEFYAKEILRIVSEAIPVYCQWFGPFGHDQFTIAESYFGWNGNECSGLVMIDERVFGMPHLARDYVDYLVSHETCHQWWYDLVGTNGYSEPFMDEAAAVYFTHKLINQKHGKNNPLFEWPQGLKWMPNVHREDYRWGSMYTAIRNGKMQPAAQDLPGYHSVFGLFTGAYDRGSKALGMIEDQLGEAAFFDFIRGQVKKYSWKLYRVADFKKDLEAYTGRDWTGFFDNWIFGKQLTDWEVKDVKVEGFGSGAFAMLASAASRSSNRLLYLATLSSAGYRTKILVRQKREITQPTRVRITTGNKENERAFVVPVGYPQLLELPEQHATIAPRGDGVWEIELSTNDFVNQVAIDPDRVLLDANPGNNVWKPQPTFRLTPLYTMLDETSMTSAHDRWNFTAGPWMWGASYPDPWYTRSTMVGLRAGANRPQQFVGGGYAAYRTDFRDIVLGVDGKWLWNMQETGFNWEHRVAGPFGGQDGASGPERASVYHRWIIKQTASMYLSPMVYHEVFANYQDNFLPFSRSVEPAGSVRWDRSFDWGWHFRANLYTPYWDPECGAWFDTVIGMGQVRMPGWTTSGQFRSELAGVHRLPDWLGPLSQVRVAARVVGMGGLPDQGQFFALGGGTLFRGYDLAQRQGSSLWVSNLELRWPILRNVEWDTLDHCVGARNAWLATFLDAGDVYANGRSVGGRVAYAAGAGLRVDVALFSFIERATLRFDVAKTINDNTPVQLWFGMNHAF